MKNAERWGMLLVLLIAALLRLAALPDLPVGLHYDEAANLILARQIATSGYRPLFIHAYTGKEVLFFYAAAPWILAAGGGVWGLRLSAAMLGILTVAATFAAVQALFRKHPRSTTMAIIAAAWMAVSFPHVLLSRYGFRAISQPLLQALTIATLWRGLRNGRSLWLIAAGICLGFTGYTYLAARLFPIPLALTLGWWLLQLSPHDRTRLAHRLATVLTVAGIVFAPMGILFLQQPEIFATRIAQVIAPSATSAAKGVSLCLRAIFWPGDGDPYIRFNAPGTPIMDILSAFASLWGLILLLRKPQHDIPGRAARLFVIIATGIMILPSALATGEITPSNLRLVGLFPFLAVLPAWGLQDALGRLPSRKLQVTASIILLLTGSVRTADLYGTWARSSALFRAADGEMVLAAQALDAQSQPGTTVYIASEHYRHPTVAALASHYAEAKWLTGGATLVLPPEGEAVYLIPEALTPPAPWPSEITEAWSTDILVGPSAKVQLIQHRLTSSQIANLRQELSQEVNSGADFAHVVLVHDARPLDICYVAEPCAMLITWEPLASSVPVQPVIRLTHPRTGEWARSMAFHYPAEQWTLHDIVLDQLVVTPPVGTPPGQGYRLSIGFYDPTQDRVLPRLREEHFAGLEAEFPTGSTGIQINTTYPPNVPIQAQEVCPSVPKDAPRQLGPLSLLGWATEAGSEILPGGKLPLRLCWQAAEDIQTRPPLTITLRGAISTTMLYVGVPGSDYEGTVWHRNEVIEGRHQLRLPKVLPSGSYTLTMKLDSTSPLILQHITVKNITRTLEIPAISHSVNVDFYNSAGPQIRLLGYNIALHSSEASWTVTLIWQALQEVDSDYVVFLHLWDTEHQTLVAQVDEMPRTGTYPTSIWMKGEIVEDAHTLRLPEEQGSTYALYIGLYLPRSGEHLLANGETRFHLANIEAKH